MRIANAAGRAVLIREDGIVDIATASGGSLPDDPQAVFDHWDELRALAERVSSADAPFERLDLLAPVPRPRQVFATVQSSSVGRSVRQLEGRRR